MAEFDYCPGEGRLDCSQERVFQIWGKALVSVLCMPCCVSWGQSLFPHLRSMTLAHWTSWFWPGKDLLS